MLPGLEAFLQPPPSPSEYRGGDAEPKERTELPAVDPREAESPSDGEVQEDAEPLAVRDLDADKSTPAVEPSVGPHGAQEQGAGLGYGSAENAPGRDGTNATDTTFSKLGEAASTQARDRDDGEAGAPQRSRTLFLPSVPADVSEEELGALFRKRGVVAPTSVRFKAKEAEGFNFVWVDFPSNESASDALVKLRDAEVRKHRRLKPVFHVEKERSTPGRGEKAFRARVKRVRDSGGDACTLLIRGIPEDVSDEDVERTVRERTEGCVRIRCSDTGALPSSMFDLAADGDDERSKKCWATFDSQDHCLEAYRVLSRTAVGFDDENRVQLNVSLHDDTTDAHHPAKKGRKLEPSNEAAPSRECTFFRRGSCRRGEGCQFKHSAANTTTGAAAGRMCRFYTSGKCQWGDKCRFVHDDSAARTVQGAIEKIRQERELQGGDAAEPAEPALDSSGDGQAPLRAPAEPSP